MGEAVAWFNAAGYLELAINHGKMASLFGDYVVLQIIPLKTVVLIVYSTKLYVFSSDSLFIAFGGTLRKLT